MCETYYCQECGCEIRNSMDIGIVGEELEYRSIIAGCEPKESFTRTVIICTSCMDAADRLMEAIADSPEFDIEAAFEEFCRQYRTDENLREVYA